MMKRIFTLLAAATLGILPLAATVPAVPDPADVKMETKSYPLSGFSELQVGWTYQVALTQADRYSVRVEAPDFVVPYLDVKVTGDRLVLDITEMTIPLTGLADRLDALGAENVVMKQKG